MDIAVVGSEEFVLGFRLAGLKRVFVADKSNYQSILAKAMADTNIGVLAVDAKDLNYLPHNIRSKVLDSIRPVVVPVGGDESDLREKVRRAIGVDLYKTEDE
jgi:V/A-type H+-transporting ATPase subunit F